MLIPIARTSLFIRRFDHPTTYPVRKHLQPHFLLERMCRCRVSSRQYWYRGCSIEGLTLSSWRTQPLRQHVFRVFRVKNSTLVWDHVTHAHLKAWCVHFAVAAGGVAVNIGDIITHGNTTFVNNGADEGGGEAQ